MISLLFLWAANADHLVELIVVGVVVWVVQLLCGAYDLARVTNNRNNRNGDGTSSNS